METIEIIKYLVGGFVGIVFAIIIGSLGALFSKKLSDKKLQKNLQKILDGKKENVYILEGKKLIADKFVIKDKSGKEIKIDLKGGILEEKNDKKENIETPEVKKAKKKRSDNSILDRRGNNRL